MHQGIVLLIKDYCKLVGTIGKVISDEKAGRINHQHQPILQRLGISDEQQFTLTTELKKHFCCVFFKKKIHTRPCHKTQVL